MEEEDNVIGAMGSMDPTTRDKLRQTIEKVERLEIEKKEVGEQIKEVFAEAKAFGFDVKAIREVIKHRKQDPDKREEAELVLGTYLSALGEI
jgi:uncharacterized protein (UPF0335 family)